jgi:hypothetical protein
MSIEFIALSNGRVGRVFAYTLAVPKAVGPLIQLAPASFISAVPRSPDASPLLPCKQGRGAVPRRGIGARPRQARQYSQSIRIRKRAKGCFIGALTLSTKVAQAINPSFKSRG